jgi:RND superfamily putative drug exporter
MIRVLPFRLTKNFQSGETMWSPRHLRSALAVVLLFLVVVGGVLSQKTPTINEPSAVSGLPKADQSLIVSERQALLPVSAIEPAIVVFYRADHQVLSPTQVSAIQHEASGLPTAVATASPASPASLLGPVQVSKDQRVAIVTLAVSAKPNDNAVSNRVLALRALLQSHPVDGVSTAVTGAPGFTTDLGRVFNGADTNLLLATVIVVALLLIATYRSPVLWLIPLLVVGMADQVSASIAAQLASHVGIRLDGASTGIAQVIVFGAGTDYALLLIARYRDQLRHEENRFVAMRKALRRTSESIVASASTVAIALGLLLTATLMGTRALGYAAGIGIVVAAIFGLFVLPSALVLFGRGLFWPLVPKNGDQRHSDGRVFGRIGAGVAKRPRIILVAAVVFLVLTSALGLGSKTGLSSTQQFTATPESVVGQNVLATAFPAGSADPVVVIAPTSAVKVARTIALGTPGVTAINDGPHTATWSEIDLTTSAAPSSQASYALINDLRSRLATVSGAAVGGDSAISLDTSNATNHDTKFLAPLILLVVLVVLFLLLRSLVAPLLLLVSVVGTYFAALGIAWFIFTHLMHFPALNTGTSFYAFLFLVALGVDYNIFLTARAKEERASLGANQGMLQALRMTGGVITSAGVLLASVFLVLGVLPLIALTQIGVIVCAGVLLDTLLVRTVLVPAIALTLGERFWWPAQR